MWTIFCCSLRQTDWFVVPDLVAITLDPDLLRKLFELDLDSRSIFVRFSYQELP